MCGASRRSCVLSPPLFDASFLAVVDVWPTWPLGKLRYVQGPEPSENPLPDELKSQEEEERARARFLCCC